MQISKWLLHAECLPGARPPVLWTVRDGSNGRFSVVLRDEQQLVVTLPVFGDTRSDTMTSCEERRRKLAVECLRELREAGRETVERGEEDGGAVGFRRVQVSMWRVRLNKWWRRTFVGEYTALFAVWMFVVVIDCMLAVMSRKWWILFCPLYTLAILLFQTAIEYWDGAVWWKYGACALWPWALAVQVNMEMEGIVGDTRWGVTVVLAHCVLTLGLACAGEAPWHERWSIWQFAVGVSVSASDGLFRLHGCGLGVPNWHRAVPLVHVHKFRAVCHSPYTLNSAMGEYYVQVQRSDSMEHSYVNFRSKRITTLVVSALNHALCQWRLQRTSSTFHT